MRNGALERRAVQATLPFGQKMSGETRIMKSIQLALQPTGMH